MRLGRVHGARRERLAFSHIGFEHDLGATLEVEPQLQAHQVPAAAVGLRTSQPFRVGQRQHDVQRQCHQDQNNDQGNCVIPHTLACSAMMMDGAVGAPATANPG